MTHLVESFCSYIAGFIHEVLPLEEQTAVVFRSLIILFIPFLVKKSPFYAHLRVFFGQVAPASLTAEAASFAVTVAFTSVFASRVQGFFPGVVARVAFINSISVDLPLRLICAFFCIVLRPHSMVLAL